jgi:hypothetical protein
MIVARDGLIEEVSAKLQYPEKHNYVIQRFNNASDEQKKLGDIWLSL